jgi:transaldolase
MSNDSYLRWLVSQTPTRWWHDSGDPQELERALAQGASGVTTNPVLTYQALRAQPASVKCGERVCEGRHDRPPAKGS